MLRNHYAHARRAEHTSLGKTRRELNEKNSVHFSRARKREKEIKLIYSGDTTLQSIQQIDYADRTELKVKKWAQPIWQKINQITDAHF